MVSCAKQVALPQRKIIYLPELKPSGVLTPQQIETNRKIINDYRAKQKLLLQIAKLDKKERKELEKKQEQITKKEKQFKNLRTALAWQRQCLSGGQTSFPRRNPSLTN